MARHAMACVVALVALSAATEQARWSRQLNAFTSDLSDWVPLPGPGPVARADPASVPFKRQAIAEPRILAEPIFPGFLRTAGFSQDFPARTYFNTNAANRQLYLQSVAAVPSAPQNYLSDQGFSQGIRFSLGQPNYPLNQAFVSPQLSFDSAPPPPPTNQRQKVSFISNPVAFPKSNLASQAKPFLYHQPQVAAVDVQKSVDGYRVEGIANFQSMKKPQSMKKLKHESQLDKFPKTEMIPPRAKSEKEEVQLVYVPIESLNKGSFNQHRNPIPAPQVIKPSNFHNQNLQRPIPNPVQSLPKQNFAADLQRPAHQSADLFKPDYYPNINSQYMELDQTPKFSTISTPFPTTLPTTPKPKKLKPHQPPLAIFLAYEAKKGNQVKVGDVLSSLKNANSVAVLDSVNPQTAPKVFIGPSNLTPPENFVRFELPYLSNIEHSDKKLRQLPFFVAPLSYNTPQGFAKIPFPSPHVGSVVINAQIKDTTQPQPQSFVGDVIPNSYTTSPQTNSRHRNQNLHLPREPQKSIQEQDHITQKPSISFFTTSSPKTNAPKTLQSNYYSFEPQTVNTVRTPKEPQETLVSGPPKQPGSYFLSNVQYQPQENPLPNFDLRDSFESGHPELVRPYKSTQPSTSRATVTSTTVKPSTYPNQLLETHNPYSINQAFQFSTPLDYHNLFDENYATPGPVIPQQHSQASLPENQPASDAPSSTSKPTESVTGKIYQTSPNYLQNNYSPEVHHESELADTRYQITKNDEYISRSQANEFSQTRPQYNYSVTSPKPLNDLSANHEIQSVLDHLDPVSTPAESDPATKSPYYQYETNYEVSKEPSPTSSTTTTTTRRTQAIRNRGRPRYTTPKADSNESTTRTVVTRKPLRERRPLPSRNRYEPNKISTERSTRRPIDSSEATTKYTRSRTRGRVQFKPTESDEFYKSSKTSSSKENDLAYQRDVLHQNYPVTIMERSSTLDIEAITEPIPRISSTKLSEPVTEVYDTENAYSYDRAAVSQHIPKEEHLTSRIETQSDTSNQKDYSYQSRISLAPVTDAFFHYEESPEKGEDFGKQTTASSKPEVTESPVAVTEQSPSSFSISEISSKTDEILTTPELEITKLSSQETTPYEELEQNIVQTTPSYNRVRVRPGVVRQYHQASSIESSRTKIRRPAQPVTYRPAFDRRRTTMRIEEIEADLKTKPLHSRPEQDYRHPVYKPEATTESYSQEATTKRGTFRRRRPTYSTTTSSTETSSSSSTTKRTYELKNRFRGRRPTTEKVTTEKLEVQTDAPTSSRSTLYNRYTRPRLSERFNKNPEPEDSADQESNYSINRPKYVEPETDQWSPKISTDTFRPYNPNEISDNKKPTSIEPSSYENHDIITAAADISDYGDILITVTPPSNNNNRAIKKMPDIPPTLEAFVEQSKTTSDSADKMTTFETMLEQVMKSLDEQDENEYTKNVMKHRGGEIGEIPPERIISSGDSIKSTTERESTTEVTTSEDSTKKEDEQDNSRRRGFWKKVKVRPVTTESIEAAESQYYANTVNRLGQTVDDKSGYDKFGSFEKPRVTTYKPAFQFLKNIFEDSEDDVYPTVEFMKLFKPKDKTEVKKDSAEIKAEKTETKTEKSEIKTENTNINLEEISTSTSENPTANVELATIFSKPDDYDDVTEFTTQKQVEASTEKTATFSFMEYLFGTAANDEPHTVTEESDYNTENYKSQEVQITTEAAKPRLPTTESTYIPEEITETGDDKYQPTYADFDSEKVMNKSIEPERTDVETASVSSYMAPENVVSTSMSTEISHETEICFRGKCVKNVKDIFSSNF